MNRQIAGLTVLLLTSAAMAQRSASAMNAPTAAEVRAGWVNPSTAYGPEPYYGLNGPVDLATVRRDLDTMKALGYGAVTVQAGYGMPFAYLSPEYLSFFKQFVAEAKTRDLHVWIVDDAGYPSGFAGGKFSALRPDLRMQALMVTQRVPVRGGETATLVLKSDTVAVTARAESGETVPVTFHAGGLSWKAPSGQGWTLEVVEHVFATSPTRSDTNPQRVKDGSQSLEDYLDPAATAQYLKFTHEAYRTAVGDEFGGTILGFRGDEPDYSIAGLPWTPKFFAAFERMKRYDVRPYLASFLPPKGSAAVMTERERRARADYADVFATLFRDGFFKPQAEWCAANKLEYQVHLNHEEMEMQLVRSEGEFFRDMQYVQVPGIDSIWHQIWTDTISDFPRLASSAAHVYGHPQAFTESFAAYRPAPDVTMARYILNEQFVRGINLVETMYFPASSVQGKGGPAAYMREAAYPALLTYVRRMSYVMSQGRPDASVALLLPSSSLWLGSTEADKAFVSTERLLSEHQIDFDVVNEDALGEGLEAVPGGLRTLSGNTFKTVILPGVEVVSESAYVRLWAFAKGGGRVLFLTRLPGLIAGQSILEARVPGPEDFAWAGVVPGELPEVPTPPANPPATAPVPMVVAPAMWEAVKAATGVQLPQLDRADTALRVMRRSWSDATVYLLFNESGEALSHSIALSGGRVEEWDVQRASVAPVAVKDGRVRLQLGAYESKVLLVR